MPPNLPAPLPTSAPVEQQLRRELERERAARGAVIGYARTLQIYAAGLVATNDRCAGEAQRNADALSVWARERERILAEGDD